MLLRDIVDLEATYDMSDISDSKLDDTFKLIVLKVFNECGVRHEDF